VTENRRSDRPADKSDKKDSERLEHPYQWVRLGEEQFAEDQRGHLAVEQEVVPLDRRADRAGIIARRKCARWSRSEKLRPEVSADAIGIPPELRDLAKVRFLTLRRIEATNGG
jgi:hypothetical protein